MSVDEPKRSFCPLCKYQIPWTSNLPLITWTIQRGKCKNCRAPIPFRYFGVELLTGLMFLAVWWKIAHASGVPFPGYWILIFPMFTFAALLIVATFIDFEHFIIPDGVTIGGAMAGLVFSAGLPWLHGETTFGLSENIRSLGKSALGAGVGFGVLWLITWFGKLAFGHKQHRYETAVPFTWKLEGERAKFICDGVEQWWDELFSSEKDTLIMDCESFRIGDETGGPCEIRSLYEKLTFNGREHDLNQVTEFSGSLTRIDYRRVAMGFGDVKFMACIGAFLGWKAALFVIFSAAVFGSIFGGVPKILGKILGNKEWSLKIPFGPYLALGALVWFFCGPEILAWYWDSFVQPPEL